MKYICDNYNDLFLKLSDNTEINSAINLVEKIFLIFYFIDIMYE